MWPQPGQCGVFRQEVGAGGTELGWVKVAATSCQLWRLEVSGGHWPPSSFRHQVRPILSNGLPRGRAGWVSTPGPQQDRRGQMARLGPRAEPVIENGCETSGWTCAGGHGIRMGLSQQRRLQSKESGSLVGVSSLRSSWASQDAIERKTSLFPLWVAHCHPRPVAQMWP